jgi:hypothetical protein
VSGGVSEQSNPEGASKRGSRAFLASACRFKLWHSVCGKVRQTTTVGDPTSSRRELPLGIQTDSIQIALPFPTQKAIPVRPAKVHAQSRRRGH